MKLDWLRLIEGEEAALNLTRDIEQGVMVYGDPVSAQGPEQWLTVDFLAALRGEEISNQYLGQYPHPNLPGWGGRSVNHHMLAHGCAIFDPAHRIPLQEALDNFELVMDQWLKVGWADHECGSRNTYTMWNMGPVMAVWDRHQMEKAGRIVRGFWAELALGAIPEPAILSAGGKWKGFATSLTGARSVKRDGDYWMHQERHYSDPWLKYALRDDMGVLNNVWIKEWVQAGCVHGLASDEQDILEGVLYGDLEALPAAVGMLETRYEAFFIVRCVDGSFSLSLKSHNGNTQYNYGVTCWHGSGVQEFLFHGDGTRKVKQGYAWEDYPTLGCRSNDHSEGPAHIDSPMGVHYVVYCDGRGKPFEILVPEQDGEPPVEPPEPPVEPPTEDCAVLTGWSLCTHWTGLCDGIQQKNLQVCKNRIAQIDGLQPSQKDRENPSCWVHYDYIKAEIETGDPNWRVCENRMSEIYRLTNCELA